MWSFLSEFVRGDDAAYTVIVMDEDYIEQPRRYHVRPFRLLLLWGVSLAAVGLLVAALATFSPLRQLIPGYGTAEMEQNARRNARQVEALEDSLQRQGRYMAHLQNLMTGPVDSTFVAKAQASAEDAPVVAGERAEVAAAPPVDNGAAEETGGPMPVAPVRLPGGLPGALPGGGGAALGQLQLPVFPPAEGFVTRGYDARVGHYAADIAVEVGTPVHSIGDGYVIMADWTQEGGRAIAVQHAGGFVSIYKHNRRLLKRVGERVHAREIIAESGNSGEITTGPHLHVELWRNGLAQDPAAYFIGW